MKPLQFASTIVLMTLTVTAGLSCANELLPERWTENVVASDGSVQQSLVFRTVPGVGYRVQSSDDLTTWVNEEEVYGMGHELVVPMRQFTPPPPTAPGTNPVVLPPRPVAFPTLLIRRSNGTAGGTVVHWR